MNSTAVTFPSDQLLRMSLESARRADDLHRQFLRMRQEGLQNARALIEMQTRAAALPAPAAFPRLALHARPALFSSQQLDAFGAGRITACLGPAFAKYENRRIPRIPNGDLKMMSRIVAIQGRQGIYAPPASVTAEYDVPPDAWYFRDAGSDAIPTGLWMEIALQPCGFLSAYLDTYALAPEGDFFFRNLDGFLRPVMALDVRGRVLSTRAWLLSNAVSGGTVIQKYGFEIACEGQVLYSGESTFGYFSASSMASQVGLDGGRSTVPAFRADGSLACQCARLDVPRLQQAEPGAPGIRLGRDRLHFIDDLYVSPQGGRFGKGYVYASRPVNPQDWFYPFHFYQDPVMPGSLGVEAVLEALRGFALANHLCGSLRTPRFTGALPGADPLTWSYRGQITQKHQQMELEVHIGAIEWQAGQVMLSGCASLWVDGLRIYELKNAALGIVEG